MTANIKVGNTEFTLGKVAEREGDFWTPVGPKHGDPDYSFAERQEANGDKMYVHITTKGRIPKLPDWSAIPEPDPLGQCITIFAAGTVTSYRLCEITTEQDASSKGTGTNTPREARPDDASSSSSPAGSAAATVAAAASAAAANKDENKPSAEAATSGGNGAPAATTTEKKTHTIAVYAPTSMSPNPPLEHCWAPKLDRLKGKYFFVNCETKAKVWCLPEVTDLGSRVRSMFRRYAPSREGDVEEIVKSHENSEPAKKEEFIQALVKEYGPEPSVIEAKTRERLGAIFARCDRNRLDNYEQLLIDNAGKEEQLIKSLLAQYGVAREPPTYRDRLTALYAKYDPAKLPTVDETLRVYHSKELQFIVAVVRKFGPDKPEPLVPCKAVKTAEELAEFRLRAGRMYQKYCQSRISTVEATMNTYAGIEELMMETLVRKYGPEPTIDEPLPELNENEAQQPESPNFSSMSFERDRGGGLPPVQGGEPMRLTPMDHAAAAGGSAAAHGTSSSSTGLPGMNFLTPEQQAQIQAQQQQSALAIVTDMEERLRGAYSRIEEAHQRAEALRVENIKLHDYSSKVMQDNDVVSQELRRQLGEASRLAEEIRAQFEAEKERVHREHMAETTACITKLQQELLRGEEIKLGHQRELSALNARLCEAEEVKGETTVQTQYLRQRVAALEEEMRAAAKAAEELRYRLKEREDVCHRGVQTGGDDAELRTELKQRKTAALRELESLGAEAQHWRSLATRLETELRAAERRRSELEKTSKEEIERATVALSQARDLNFALEDRVAVLEAELLATPSSSTGNVGETELRARLAELQREMADAQATIRGQRQQVNDLRGLLAMHMAAPAQGKGAAASIVSPNRTSPRVGSAASTAAASSAASPSSSSRKPHASGTFRF